MTQLIEMPDSDVTCPNSRCHRKNCDQHCWSCGRPHDSEETGTPFCMKCELAADDAQAPLFTKGDEVTGLTWLGIQEDLRDDEDD